MAQDKATFAAGCFWGVEATFRRLPGVTDAAVGYTGGTVVDPGYERVCAGQTGHAEAVEITFDPAQITFETLLETFFANHDPTQVNRQGPDVGTQYRTAVFFHSPEQEQQAQAMVARLTETGRFSKPIATQIVPAETFYRAEEYHQQYLAKRGRDSCSI